MNKQTISLVIVALVALAFVGLQARNTGMAQAYQHIMKDFDQTPEFNCLYYNILREIMRQQEPVELKRQQSRGEYDASVASYLERGYPANVLITEQWKDVSIQQFHLERLDWDRSVYCNIAAKKCEGDDWTRKAMIMAQECYQWFSHYRARVPRCCEREPILPTALPQKPNLGTIKSWSDYFEPE